MEHFGSDMTEFMLRTIYTYLKNTDAGKNVKNQDNVIMSFAEFITSEKSKTALKTFHKSEIDTHACVSKCVKSFANVHGDLERRYVGKALNHAPPGSMIDVLIGAS